MVFRGCLTEKSVFKQRPKGGKEERDLSKEVRAWWLFEKSKKQIVEVGEG